MSGFIVRMANITGILSMTADTQNHTEKEQQCVPLSLSDLVKDIERAKFRLVSGNRHFDIVRIECRL